VNLGRHERASDPIITRQPRTYEAHGRRDA
jgi:hypothetical protein